MSNRSKTKYPINPKNKPVIIDYVIDRDKKVFPMVAPGAPIHQIINEDDVNI